MDKSPLHQAVEPKVGLSVDEAAALIGIGKSKAYELIRERKLPARKIGARTIILRDDVNAFLRSLPSVAA